LLENSGWKKEFERFWSKGQGNIKKSISGICLEVADWMEVNQFKIKRKTFLKKLIYIYNIIIIGIQPLGRSGQRPDSVRRLVWLWYAASWASS